MYVRIANGLSLQVLSSDPFMLTDGKADDGVQMVSNKRDLVRL
jgi:hypothetical protein